MSQSERPCVWAQGRPDGGFSGSATVPPVTRSPPPPQPHYGQSTVVQFRRPTEQTTRFLAGRTAETTRTLAKLQLQSQSAFRSGYRDHGLNLCTSTGHPGVPRVDKVNSSHTHVGSTILSAYPQAACAKMACLGGGRPLAAAFFCECPNHRTAGEAFDALDRRLGTCAPPLAPLVAAR